MNKLVRLYIQQVLLGFALSGIFVTALLYLNVGNLWGLISTSSMGWVAVLMLFMFHGVVFAGVQFSIAIMRLEKKDSTPKGGTRVPTATNIPIRVEATQSRKAFK